MGPSAESRDLYESLATELCELPGVTRSTMMGFPCLRSAGALFASLEPRTGHLVVKLPVDEVARLVASGQGLPFAPNGRSFREWVAVPVPDEEEWRALLGDARAFADR